ncbi:MAG: hypothetical protein DRP63_07905 [Planctomycetota bacterium]|nr:MAG: hypothetical protein DRP63_07905 [Planctomycetota bacterium]
MRCACRATTKRLKIHLSSRCLRLQNASSAETRMRLPAKSSPARPKSIRRRSLTKADKWCCIAAVVLAFLCVFLLWLPQRRPLKLYVACNGQPRLQVPVNSAPAELLSLLPGVGDVTVEKIIGARRKQPIRSLEDLARATGLGPKALKRLAEYVRF